jgi:hypothetical protein
MNPTNLRLRWIAPMFGLDQDLNRIGVKEPGKKQLNAMGKALAGTDDLVAIYVPLTTPGAYKVGGMAGHVAGAVKLKLIPEDKGIEDYGYPDDGISGTYPYGWPCEVVFLPPVTAPLRDLVPLAFGAKYSLQDYTAGFQRGPFQLDPAMTDAIVRFFERTRRS